jgi:UrcA family protein
VRYQRADLDTSEGVAILYRRIRAAATIVCLPLESALLEHNVLRNECFNHSVADAVRAVHSETLSLYHWRRIRGWKQLPIESPTSLAAAQ